MSSNPKETVWSADPHTKAKIQILSYYLNPYFQILGRSHGGCSILYVDGFAGPGEYKRDHNSSVPVNGSPIIAINEAIQARIESGSRWKAGPIKLAFIEKDSARAEHLARLIHPHRGRHPNVLIEDPLCTDFEHGITQLSTQHRENFGPQCPLFVFIDPFGATGAPFSIVKSILNQGRAEILINLDTDGINRIHRSGDASNAERVLTNIFGDDSWRAIRDASESTAQRGREYMSLYRARLENIGIRYHFPFEMRKSGSIADYFLIFASQHERGLEKMKEAMKRVKSDYCFIDATDGHIEMFDETEVTTQHYIEAALDRFHGQKVSADDFYRWVLNETPFLNFQFVRVPVREGRIAVAYKDGARKDLAKKNIEFLEFNRQGVHSPTLF